MILVCCFRIGEIVKGLCDAVDADLAGHQRGRIDLPSAIRRSEWANSSGV